MRTEPTVERAIPASTESRPLDAPHARKKWGLPPPRTPSPRRRQWTLPRRPGLATGLARRSPQPCRMHLLPLSQRRQPPRHHQPRSQPPSQRRQLPPSIPLPSTHHRLCSLCWAQGCQLRRLRRLRRRRRQLRPGSRPRRRRNPAPARPNPADRRHALARATAPCRSAGWKRRGAAGPTAACAVWCLSSVRCPIASASARTSGGRRTMPWRRAAGRAWSVWSSTSPTRRATTAPTSCRAACCT